jgi:hypothetical protein
MRAIARRASLLRYGQADFIAAIARMCGVAEPARASPRGLEPLRFELADACVDDLALLLRAADAHLLARA